MMRRPESKCRKWGNQTSEVPLPKPGCWVVWEVSSGVLPESTDTAEARLTCVALTADNDALAHRFLARESAFYPGKADCRAFA